MPVQRTHLLGLVAVAVLWAAAAPVYGESELEACQRLAPQYNAQCEVVLWDRSRVDLLTDTEAIEVDWASKWPEAIGQSQWYSIVTGKRAAVLLLVRDPQAEARYIYRATAVCERLGVRLYLEVSPEDAPPPHPAGGRGG